jgi:hypothetical protein
MTEPFICLDLTVDQPTVVEFESISVFENLYWYVAILCQLRIRAERYLRSNGRVIRQPISHL